MAKTIKVANLVAGQFAVTDNGMAVICLSPRSFVPKFDTDGYAVNLANGVGAFPKTTRCRIVTADEAFEVARKYLAGI